MPSFKAFMSELKIDTTVVPKAEHGLADALIKLFTEKAPKDAEVHAIAKKMGVTTEEAEDLAYSMLHSFLSKFGKHNGVPDEKFDAAQLKLGIKMEHEHTDDGHIAELIAKDHLSEIPDYYARLDKMEDEAEK